MDKSSHHVIYQDRASIGLRPKIVWYNLLITLLSVFSCVSCGTNLKDQQVKNAKYHHRLAYGHFIENHDSEAALQEILKSLKLNPNVPEVHMLAGLIYTGRRDLLKALKHYRTAIELKPDYFEAKNNLGTVYLSLNMWEQAINVFNELITRDEYRTPAMGYNNLGWAHHKLNQDQVALKHFITATQLGPRLCPPHNNVGMLYLKRGEIDKAKRSLKTAIKRCPQYAEPYLHLGRLYAQSGQAHQAITQWQTCQKLAPENEIGLRCESLSEQIKSEVP